MPKKDYFEIKEGKLVRSKKHCPKCGPGVFLAEHKDRTTCGKCSYTEFKKPKVEPKPEDKKPTPPKEEMPKEEKPPKDSPPQKDDKPAPPKEDEPSESPKDDKPPKDEKSPEPPKDG